MKKFLVLLAGGVLFFALTQPLSAEGGLEKALRIGATPIPHAELLEFIKGDLEKAGIKLEIIIYNDYELPNTAILSGVLDANYLQHLPHLEASPNKRELVPVFGVHVEPMGLYSMTAKTIGDLKDGSTIAVAKNPTDKGRALLLLQSKGLIKLAADSGLTATPMDITDNPHNFQFKELEAGLLPRSLVNTDAAVINGNFALAANFVPARDALILEGADSPYINIVVVKKGNENDSRIQMLKKILLSRKVKNYIEKKWRGSVVAVF